MTVEAIREVMHRNHPLRIRSSDGREFLVPHPDFISVGSESDGVMVIHTERGITILDLPNVTAVDLDSKEDAGAASK